MRTSTESVVARFILPGWPLFLSLFAALLFAPRSTELSVEQPKSEWKALFNGRDLAGWDKFIASANGSDPIIPNRDPKNVFTVTNLNGETVIHVSGEIYGAITTQAEFENFHARLEFKWGQKR